MPNLRTRYDFFRKHAGGIVGESARGALALARAETLLDEAIDLGVATAEWEYDPEPYDPGDAATAKDVARYFAENTWTGPFVCTIDTGEAIASCSGIVVGPRELNDPYCRVIVAELASEIADDLRQVIGDERDREACTFA